MPAPAVATFFLPSPPENSDYLRNDTLSVSLRPTSAPHKRQPEKFATGALGRVTHTRGDGKFRPRPVENYRTGPDPPRPGRRRRVVCSPIPPPSPSAGRRGLAADGTGCSVYMQFNEPITPRPRTLGQFETPRLGFPSSVSAEILTELLLPSAPLCPRL